MSGKECDHRYWARSNIGDICQTCGEEECHPQIPPMSSEQCVQYNDLAQRIQETTGNQEARTLIAEIRAVEREACIKELETLAAEWDSPTMEPDTFMLEQAETFRYCAEQLRKNCP